MPRQATHLSCTIDPHQGFRRCTRCRKPAGRWTSLGGLQMARIGLQNAQVVLRMERLEPFDNTKQAAKSVGAQVPNAGVRHAAPGQGKLGLEVVGKVQTDAATCRI